MKPVGLLPNTAVSLGPFWEILPTHLSVSSLSVGSLWGSLGALVFLYTGLLIVEAWLMVRFAKIGPSSLGTGAYHHEQAAK